MAAGVEGVKAVVFDTFGTVVDWRGSIIADLSRWGAEEKISSDWEGLADAWRDKYEPQKERVRSGVIPWANLDQLHYEALLELLPAFGLSSLTPEQRSYVHHVWHRLNGWPDATAGLRRLKANYIIGPLSNGNIALLVNMAKHANLSWDAIFSVESFGHYKPHPDTYLGVARQLGLEPEQVMMCAAHPSDLQAAQQLGLKTAYISRPLEFGPNKHLLESNPGTWDVEAEDIEDLARKLGC